MKTGKRLRVRLRACVRIIIILLQLLIFNYSLLIETPATIRYVSKTGSSTPPYTSWATAADSIQKCINICEYGDTIYVANGVYEEQVVMIPGLSLIGAGMDSCIIDTRSLANNYNFNSVTINDSCLFKGFQVIIANQDFGNGIMGYGQVYNRQKGLITMNLFRDGVIGIYLLESDITVKNNICLNNKWGMVIDYSNSLVSDNYISSDYDSDRGIDLSDLAHLRRPVIMNNYIETNAFGIISDFGPQNITVQNNIILVKDNGGLGISIGYYTDTAMVTNNLILAKEYFTFLNGISTAIDRIPKYIINNLVFNKPGSQGGGIYTAGINTSMSKFLNNLIIGGEYGIYNYNNPSDTVPAYYNNIWDAATNSFGCILDSTNITVDPMIVNDDTTQGELDFHLQKFSPLIDAGDPAILDLDGTRSDIGLYGGPFGQRYVYQDLPPKPPVNLTALVDTGRILLRWNRNTEADTSHYRIFRSVTSGFTADSATLIAATEDSFYVDNLNQEYERLYYKISCVDRQGNQSNASEEIAIVFSSINNYPITINDYCLYQNYPNPFNPTTKIGYRLKEDGYVKLYVYNIKGEVVDILVNEHQEGGYYEVEFNTEEFSQLASGFYIYQIMVRGRGEIPVFTDSKKMLFIK